MNLLYLLKFNSSSTEMCTLSDIDVSGLKNEGTDMVLNDHLRSFKRLFLKMQCYRIFYYQPDHR